MNEKYLNKLSKEIHDNNVAVGWYDGDTCVYEKLQLVSTEVSEATEGARKGLMDDHLPQYHMEGVELADALIRTLDLGGYLGLTCNGIGGFTHPLVDEGSTTGKSHLAINMSISDMTKAYFIGKEIHVLNDFYTGLISIILQVAKARKHNIARMMVDKLEYNKSRLDHKRENRNKEGGKKF